jgi:hypothetical protein
MNFVIVFGKDWLKSDQTAALLLLEMANNALNTIEPIIASNNAEGALIMQVFI